MKNSQKTFIFFIFHAFYGKTIGKSQNRIHTQPVKVNDTETMYQLHNECASTGSMSHGNLDYLLFKSQTFLKKNCSRFCALAFSELQM